jgi:hypothetical protein
MDNRCSVVEIVPATAREIVQAIAPVIVVVTIKAGQIVPRVAVIERALRTVPRAVAIVPRGAVIAPRLAVPRAAVTAPRLPTAAAAATL